ncbi:MAG TPA: AAA family ATPase, partial [Promineifilum sp.]
LALQGYKTFASKTEFVFDSGITAIVGPNGSGKSNIADAMRWVLGEQSYGALRARRSADMIFSGSNGRARAGMAQATITLDNSDGWLPIDFTEVEIARRSFRSGENEYLINGRNVRLKDVAELLATSGLGERTYTIIGQGLVDQALSLRSDERRALFEEAAGITHYKTRRAETLRRLDETQRNLQRVIDILDELRPRVANLRRQATRTRNYEQISTDLHELLLTWYGYRWEQLKRELHSARQAATQAELAWSVARNKLLAHQEQIDAVQVELANAQQQMATLQSDRDRIRQEAERARRSLAIQRERHKAYERQIAEIETELPPLEQTATKAQMEVDQAMADLAEAQAALQAQQTALQEYRSASASHRTQITHWQREVLRHETERQQSRTALAQAEGQLSQLRERRAELGDVEQPDADAAGAGQDIRRLEEQVAAARAESTRLQAARSDESGARAAEISRIKEMRRSAKEAEQSLNRLRHDLARQEERAAQLDRRGQRAISLKSDGVRGRLASHLQVPNDHQTAVLSALGDRLAAWLVDDSESLWQIVDRLQSDKVEDEERHLLASLDGSDPTKQQRPQVSGENGVIGWADGLVSADDRVAPLVGRLLGSVLLVKDAASAYRLAVRWPAGFSAVAPDGLVVHGGGVVEVGGASRNDILTLEDRRREIAGRLDEMRAALAASETSHGVQLSAIDSLQERVDGRAAEEQRLTGLEAEAARQLAQAQSQLDRARQEREFAARRRESRANERHQVLERIRQNEDAISRFT